MAFAVYVNVKKINFNQDTVLVYHITDDVTGSPKPICGARPKSLSSVGDLDEYVKNFTGIPSPVNTDDQYCVRCSKAYHVKFDASTASRKRLERYQHNLSNNHRLELEQKVISSQLSQCPLCELGTLSRSYSEYSLLDCSAFCSGCNVTWRISGWVNDLENSFFVMISSVNSIPVPVKGKPKTAVYCSFVGTLHGKFEELNDIKFRWIANKHEGTPLFADLLGNGQRNVKRRALTQPNN